MRLQRFSDPAQSCWVAGPFLLQLAAAHNLILSICQTLIEGANKSMDTPYPAIAEEEDEVIASCLQIPPRNLVLSHSTSRQAVRLVADSPA